MAQGTIGLHVTGRDAAAVVANIGKAEGLGIPAAWVTTGGVGPDGLTILAAAAVKTGRILLGTSIVPSFPRHPLVMVEQAVALAALAPGRFRLGIGPSHKPGIEGMFGIPFRRPLTHLRAYLKVVKGLLQDGAADVDEGGVVAHAKLDGPPPGVPVMASALQAGSFELCGEVADGAITWLCPRAYVGETALPALQAGAAKAGRAAPPLIMHIPVAVHEDAAAVRAAVRQGYGRYLNTISYPQMLAASGYPEALQGEWSDALIDAVVAHGSEAAVGDRLRGLLAMGAGELIVSPVGAGADTVASVERVWRLLADLAPTAARIGA